MNVGKFGTCPLETYGRRCCVGPTCDESLSSDEEGCVDACALPGLEVGRSLAALGTGPGRRCGGGFIIAEVGSRRKGRQ